MRSSKTGHRLDFPEIEIFTSDFFSLSTEHQVTAFDAQMWKKFALLFGIGRTPTFCLGSLGLNPGTDLGFFCSELLAMYSSWVLACQAFTNNV